MGIIKIEVVFILVIIAIIGGVPFYQKPSAWKERMAWALMLNGVLLVDVGLSMKKENGYR